MLARDVMTSPVITVTPSATIQEAAALLATHGFTALPVVDGNCDVIGIVTEADLVRDRFPRDPRSLIHDPKPGPERTMRPGARTVGDVMSAPAGTMPPGTDLADLTGALLETGRRCVPIVDGSRLVGIVTRRDLVRVVGRDDTTIARDVRRRLELYGGPGRWQVEVHGGVVTLADEFDDENERHVATALAQAVPGVLRASFALAGSDEEPRHG